MKIVIVLPQDNFASNPISHLTPPYPIYPIDHIDHTSTTKEWTNRSNSRVMVRVRLRLVTVSLLFTCILANY